MDGLMFDTERLFIDSFTGAVAAQTGMDFPAEKMYQLVGLNHADTVARWPQLFDTSKHSIEECYAIADAWRVVYHAEHGVPVKAGLVELLDWLTARGVRLAVATGSSRETAEQFMAMVGIRDRFELLVSGGEVDHGKPDPEIFNKTAAALGCADHADCVIFEDSRNGLRAAVAGGFPVVIVPDLFDPTDGYADRIFAKVKTLHDAIPVLEPHCPAQ